MKSGWVDRDAEAIVADGAKAGIDPDLSLRLYTTRLLGRDPKLVEKLATLEEQAGHADKAAAALDRLNYIYPEDQELHKRLGDIWLAQNNLPGAIREYQAWVALKPLDQATAHYDLAEAYRLLGDSAHADEHMAKARWLFDHRQD